MLKALVVDDSKYQRYIIELALAGYCRCEQAVDGDEAVLLFEQALQEDSPYNLVVLDILMPNMDGHRALHRMNKLQKQYGLSEERCCKVVMLSSLDDPKNMMRAQFDEGAHAYITKPFEDVLLIETLRNLDLIDNPLGEDDFSDMTDEREQ